MANKTTISKTQPEALDMCVRALTDMIRRGEVGHLMILAAPSSDETEVTTIGACTIGWSVRSMAKFLYSSTIEQTESRARSRPQRTTTIN